MLSKIFIKNFSAHKNNYIVYIASSASAVMVYFILFFLTKNPVLNSSNSSWSGNFNRVADALNFFLIVLEWFFVAYISGIFIKERKKEFDLYKFLGISKYRMAFGILVETVFIQLISWMLGFLLAVILSKFFGMLLIKIMNLKITYQFFLNLNIVGASIQLFLIFTCLLGILNFIRVIRLKSRQKSTKSWRFLRYSLGILGAILIVYGYIQAVKNSGMALNAEIGPKVAYANEAYFFGELPAKIFFEVTLGTLFLYVGFIEVIINVIGKSSSIKNSGLKNITSKLFIKSVRNNVTSLWIITIVSGLSIVIFFIVTIIIQSINYYDDTAYPYDIAVTQNHIEKTKKVLFESGSKIKKTSSVNVKQCLGAMESIDKNAIDIYSFISYNDYKKAMTPIGNKYNDKIGPNDTMLLNDSSGLLLNVPQEKTHETFKFISGQELKIQHSGRSLPISPHLYYGRVIVVPQKTFDNISSKYQMKLYGLNYTHATSDSLNKKLKIGTKGQIAKYTHKKVINIGETITKKNVNDSPPENVYEVQKKDYQISNTVSNETKQNRGFTIFILSLLSIVFIVALESILSIKQFSENIRNKQMYQTIKDLGIGKDNINKLVFRQTALLFYLPMILAIVDAVFAANYLMRFTWDRYWIIFIIILITYIAFYSILFFITERISKIQVNKMLS